MNYFEFDMIKDRPVCEQVFAKIIQDNIDANPSLTYSEAFRLAQEQLMREAPEVLQQYVEFIEQRRF